MCGIAGAVSTRDVDGRLVERMCAVLEHRGPDESGIYTAPHVALGIRRLAIVDVAGGQQPVHNEDRTISAVMNGEIYNYRALQAELEGCGHRFRSASDSECLVHAYEEWGADLVSKLRGMIAFAIWDAARRRLVLARDRVGKKPLYWRETADGLAFASELKGLLADPSVSRRVDRTALHHYLTFQYVPAPWSIVDGVRKLRPGHLLTWQHGHVTERRYWRIDFTPRADEPEPALEAEFRTRLLEATRLRTIGERPLGAFLSGGVDSSAVVAALARQSAGRVRTFSIGFEDPAFDERRYARLVAERYGTDHHELVVEGTALDVLPALASHFDEPFADWSAIPSFYVARLTKRLATVALNGDGGDEAFGGYPRYGLLGAFERLSRLWPAPRAVGLLAGRLADRTGRFNLVRRAGRAIERVTQPAARRYCDMVSYFNAAQKRRLYADTLQQELAGVDSAALIEEAFAASRATDVIGRAMDADINTYLPGDLLVKVDMTTMANSLEARSPFLDHPLLEWAAGLPTSLKVRAGRTKYLLKNAMRDWLPAEILDRPKVGFGVPMASWLRKELRPLAYDVLTDDTARRRGLFRPDAVSDLLRAHQAGTDHAVRLWALIQFEQWHRTFVDGTPASAGERR